MPSASVRDNAVHQVDEERRLRRMAEIRMRDSRSRLSKAERALQAVQDEKDSLEAELMEAATDVMDFFLNSSIVITLVSHSFMRMLRIFLT